MNGTEDASIPTVAELTNGVLPGLLRNAEAMI